MEKLAVQSEPTKHTRKLSYDILRVLCAAAVCVVHFEEAISPLMTQQSTPLFAGFSLNLLGTGLAAGNLAVGIFFMLSGALSLKTIQDSHFSAKTYMSHRLNRLLPPLWISWFLVCVWRAQQGRFFFDVPTWRFVFTIVGIDGYIYSQTSIETFYLVGEWFYGAIIFVTLLWTVVRKCYLKLGGWFTVTLVGCVEVASIFVCQMSGISPWRTIPVCLFSFVLGAYIASTNLLRHQRAVIPLALLFILIGFLPTPLCVTVRYQLVGGGIILLAEFYEQRRLETSIRESQQSNGHFERVMTGLSALTLYFFMFQHVVGIELIEAATPYISSTFGTGNYWGLVTLTLLLTLLIALVVYKLESWIRTFLT